MSSWLGFGSEHLEELGIRLVSMDRPGLGLSDPHPEKTLASWADDIRQLISSCDLRDVAAVGFSQGAPFALALAGHGLVRALAIVSGPDELAHPNFSSQLHADVARIIKAIENDPAGFEKHFSGIATADGLWQLIIGMSAECDRQLYMEDAFGCAFERSLQEGFSQGAAAYARDLVNAMARWPFSLEEIAVPVSLWYGRADTSTVHSPDFGSTLAKRLPNASLHVFESEGGSLLWTRSREILEHLLDEDCKQGPRA